MSRKKKSFYEKKGYKEPLKLTKDNDTLKKVYEANKNEINTSFKSFKDLVTEYAEAAVDSSSVKMTKREALQKGLDKFSRSQIYRPDADERYSIYQEFEERSIYEGLNSKDRQKVQINYLRGEKGKFVRIKDSMFEVLDEGSYFENEGDEDEKEISYTVYKPKSTGVTVRENFIIVRLDYLNKTFLISRDTQGPVQGLPAEIQAKVEGWFNEM